MVSLASLWVPIVVSAVIVFIASSILHMVLPLHRSDYRPLPDEDKIAAAIRTANVRPGLYMVPWVTHKEMNSPATQEKLKQGPVGTMAIRPNGPIVMPKLLGQWFVFCLIINFFVAYLTSRTLGPGTDYLRVFQVAGTAGFMAYGLSQLMNSIWKGQPWGVTIKEVVDGLIYGLLTAGTFGWLWPR